MFMLMVIMQLGNAPSATFLYFSCIKQGALVLTRIGHHRVEAAGHRIIWSLRTDLRPNLPLASHNSQQPR